VRYGERTLHIANWRIWQTDYGKSTVANWNIANWHFKTQAVRDCKRALRIQISKWFSLPWDHDRDLKFYTDVVKAYGYKSCFINFVLKFSIWVRKVILNIFIIWDTLFSTAILQPHFSNSIRINCLLPYKFSNLHWTLLRIAKTVAQFSFRKTLFQFFGVTSQSWKLTWTVWLTYWKSMQVSFKKVCQSCGRICH